MVNNVMLQTDCPLLGDPYRGKVRDIFDLETHLLIITTDRVSAFDVVLPNGIPNKGIVLNQISKLWFDFTKDIIPNHMVSTNVDEYASHCPGFEKAFSLYRNQLIGRSMLVKKAKPLAIEAIVRGYISGSGWKSYQKNNTVCGIGLPEGLVESQKLPHPLYTPSTKAEQGEHDENINFEQTVDIVGLKIAGLVSTSSLMLYERCSALALATGIIIADTKFEFGIDERGRLILIDEVLTPDSSRFWPLDTYQPGGPQKSMDKQYIRDYLDSLDWDKNPPGPKLPNDIVDKTETRYLQAYCAIKKIAQTV